MRAKPIWRAAQRAELAALSDMDNAIDAQECRKQNKSGDKLNAGDSKIDIHYEAPYDNTLPKR